MTNDRSSAASPSGRYISLIRGRIAAIRKDISKLTALGEKMASPLLAGGNMVCPPVAEYWWSESYGRAGGLMGLRIRDYQPQSNKDVALFAIPSKWTSDSEQTLKRLIESPGRLFVIGRKESLKGRCPLNRISGFTGGVDPKEGLYGLDPFRPLATLWQFEQIVRGWITTGEMIAACTRAGRMPIMYMSIWIEGGFVRNSSFLPERNNHEPWYVPFFHADRYIPPLARGYAGNEFLDALEKIVDALAPQQNLLAKAAKWMAEAKKAGNKVWTIAVGHSYPMALELPASPAADKPNDPKAVQYPLDWGRSNSNLTTAIPPKYGKGDVALHLGYAPVDIPDVANILNRGIRFIHTSPYGRPAALKDHSNLLWFDLPWRPTDQTVDVPGYGVRIMPMSSSAQTVAYFAILSEMAERMEWK